MDGDVDPFLLGIPVLQFLIGAQAFFCLNNMTSLLLIHPVHQTTKYTFFEHYLEQIRFVLIFPVRPLIMQPYISRVTVNVTFLPIFIIINLAKPLVFLCL